VARERLDESVPTALNGHDTRGRFTAGNRVAAGRRSRTAEVAAAIARAGTPERIEALLLALHARGLRGDTFAAKLFLHYTAGRPAYSIDLGVRDADDAPPFDLERYL
jgi:hypothetical protein